MLDKPGFKTNFLESLVFPTKSPRCQDAIECALFLMHFACKCTTEVETKGGLRTKLARISQHQAGRAVFGTNVIIEVHARYSTRVFVLIKSGKYCFQGRAFTFCSSFKAGSTNWQRMTSKNTKNCVGLCITVIWGPSSTVCER